MNTWRGVKFWKAFSIFWSFMKRFWCGLKQKSIQNLEHHVHPFPELNFEKNDHVVILEVLKVLKMYESPRYWIFLLLESWQLWSRPLLRSYFNFMWSWPPPVFFFVLYTCGISKHTFFWSGSSKKAIFLKFYHFSHSMWSSNSGHEHEKGSHMNPMDLYCTIDLWHIKA